MREVEGLGLLNIETELHPEKTVKNSKSKSIEYSLPLSGYEIHMGQTTGKDCRRPMIDFGTHQDGAINTQGNVRGCYLHGLFGSDAYRKALLQSAGFSGGGDVSYMETVEQALDELAEEMERWLDVDGLLGMAK